MPKHPAKWALITKQATSIGFHLWEQGCNRSSSSCWRRSHCKKHTIWPAMPSQAASPPSSHRTRQAVLSCFFDSGQACDQCSFCHPDCLITAGAAESPAQLFMSLPFSSTQLKLWTMPGIYALWSETFCHLHHPETDDAVLPRDLGI